MCHLGASGNLFEGEWKEGKPQVKAGDKAAGGPMDWLNEAVATVSANIGVRRRRALNPRPSRVESSGCAPPAGYLI